MLRLLEAHEINARVKTVICTDRWKGVTLLLYKDARCDMAILDEQYGQNNWQVDYQMVGSQMFCTISIWDADKGQWIRKQSNGVESNTEAEKGQASDAFKRAGFMVGIGRELYTAPDIFIDCAGEGEITSQKDNYGKEKFKCNCEFTVTDIDYDENRNICYLVITKKYRKNESVCLTWGKKQTPSKQIPAPKAKEPAPKHEEPAPEANTEQTNVPECKLLWDELLRICDSEDKVKSACKSCGVLKRSDLTKFNFERVKHVLEGMDET